jgi:hypothetical protein
MMSAQITVWCMTPCDVPHRDKDIPREPMQNGSALCIHQSRQSPFCANTNLGLLLHISIKYSPSVHYYKIF